MSDICTLFVTNLVQLYHSQIIFKVPKLKLQKLIPINTKINTNIFLKFT